MKHKTKTLFKVLLIGSAIVGATKLVHKLKQDKQFGDFEEENYDLETDFKEYIRSNDKETSQRTCHGDCLLKDTADALNAVKEPDLTKDVCVKQETIDKPKKLRNLK